jgi:hypothetical protein
MVILHVNEETYNFHFCMLTPLVLFYMTLVLFYMTLVLFYMTGVILHDFGVILHDFGVILHDIVTLEFFNFLCYIYIGVSNLPLSIYDFSF